MDVSKCDICGKDYKFNDEEATIGFFVLGQKGEFFDLCPNCTRKLREWVDRKRGLNEDKNRNNSSLCDMLCSVRSLADEKH